MTTGAITPHIDVAQLVLYTFWIFFAALVYYLRREDKREGYPLESSRTVRSGGRVKVIGFPAPPPPKTFRLADGTTVTAPGPDRGSVPASLRSLGSGASSPAEPVGDPMRAAAGPGAYPKRADAPDLTLDGHPRIVPLRGASGFSVATPGTDPRGMAVHGADGARGGTVKDLWIDLAEPQVRYLEVDAQGRSVLLPMALARIDADRGRVTVRAVLGRHFAGVPQTARPDRITRLEEEQVCAYYAAGTLYAEPSRAEPWL
ncbi:MAG: photosynthetic reaction center subunit H [Proteobacteria bacterium]|nr:photosynthetic reaction center subunit H [Pseudomonadota bacterium]